MCGVQEIDVADRESSAVYGGGFDASSETVIYFWAVVRTMTAEERSKVLLFCTGSARVPATGFANLMGYSGNQQCFSLTRVQGGSERLPTASTCFNNLRLPEGYDSEEHLRERLCYAMESSEGFDETAVAH